jgi:two-component system, sensor histidine kinase and response regulator
MARVLLVDDDEEIRGLYQQIVCDMGHEVVVAGDAKEAKAVIQSCEDMDVAVIDRILPGEQDGLDILKFIQANRPHCRGIIISGHPSFDSAQEALRANACDYLAKPVRKERFCQAVRAALEEKKLVEERALEVERSKRGFEELKSKQEMLQHDMRSLVIGIVGFSNLLIEKTPLTKVQLEYCKQIRQCGLHLGNMVNTYLDISNLERESFRLNKTRFNLLDIIKQSRKTLHFLADEKNVEISMINNKKMLSIEDVITFEGDRMYLQNAIDNLVKNAIEASPPDKRVKIKVKNNKKNLLVSIHNWGTVPKTVRPSFFRKYTTSGKKDGLGLGAYMAKLVVDAHGGKIGVKSSEDVGTEITMAFPLPSVG